MESDSLYARAGTRAAFGPDSRPPDLKHHEIGARNTSGTGKRTTGGPRFTWEVSVEIPDKTSPCSVGGGPSSSQQSPALHQASARTSSLSGSIMPVDDPVVVKNLTSQVSDWSKAFHAFSPRSGRCWVLDALSCNSSTSACGIRPFSHFPRFATQLTYIPSILQQAISRPVSPHTSTYIYLESFKFRI